MLTSEATPGPQAPPNFSWCEDNVLSASAFPSEAEHLAYLLSVGITCLISLTEERHVKAYQPEDSNLRIVRIPVTDYTPPTHEQVQQFIDEVNSTKSKGEASCVHCAHGLGRTGTMLACYFVAVHGDNPEMAVDRIRRLRPGSIETAQQEALVYSFHAHLLQQRS